MRAGDEDLTNINTELTSKADSTELVAQVLDGVAQALRERYKIEISELDIASSESVFADLVQRHERSVTAQHEKERVMAQANSLAAEDGIELTFYSDEGSGTESVTALAGALHFINQVSDRLRSGAQV